MSRQDHIHFACKRCVEDSILLGYSKEELHLVIKCEREDNKIWNPFFQFYFDAPSKKRIKEQAKKDQFWYQCYFYIEYSRHCKKSPLGSDSVFMTFRVSMLNAQIPKGVGCSIKLRLFGALNFSKILN